METDRRNGATQITLREIIEQNHRLISAAFGRNRPIAGCFGIAAISLRPLAGMRWQASHHCHRLATSRPDSGTADHETPFDVDTERFFPLGLTPSRDVLRRRFVGPARSVRFTVARDSGIARAARFVLLGSSREPPV
jgi:hypothetical protein